LNTRISQGRNKMFGKGNAEKGQIVEHLDKDHQGKPEEMSMSTEDHQGNHHQEDKVDIDKVMEINTETIEAINEAHVRIQEGEMTTAMVDKKEMIVASEEEEEIQEVLEEMLGKETTTMRIQREQTQDLKEAQSKRRTTMTTTKMSIDLLKKRKKLHSKPVKQQENQSHSTTMMYENKAVKEIR